MAPYFANPSSNGNLDGLIRKSGEIPLFSSTEITSNSNPYTQVFDSSSSYQLCTINHTDSFFMFSFPKRYLILSKYTLTSNPSWSENSNFPVNWIVEGKVRNKWINVSLVENSGLKSQRAQTFESKTEKPLSALKLTMIGTSAAGKYYFCIHKLDFFGALISRSSIYNYCFSPKKYKHYMKFYTTLLITLYSV